MGLNTTNDSLKHKYVDPRAEGQRKGAIGHYASRMVAAMITTEGPDCDIEKVARSFHKLVELLEKDFSK